MDSCKFMVIDMWSHAVGKTVYVTLNETAWDFLCTGYDLYPNVLMLI